MATDMDSFPDSHKYKILTAARFTRKTSRAQAAGLLCRLWRVELFADTSAFPSNTDYAVKVWKNIHTVTISKIIIF